MIPNYMTMMDPATGKCIRVFFDESRFGYIYGTKEQIAQRGIQFPALTHPITGFLGATPLMGWTMPPEPESDPKKALTSNVARICARLLITLRGLDSSENESMKVLADRWMKSQEWESKNAGKTWMGR